MAGPVLTFPEAEAEAVRAAYAAAEVILEYGSGGSTVLAAGMPGKTVLSVESDPDWARMVETHARAEQKAETVVVLHADIGPVRRWGKPSSRRHTHLFHRYPFEIWSHPTFRHPDVVLIDGRFRPACFVAVALMIERPVTVLFDDYKKRTEYARVVERLAQPAEMIGRMARFELQPRPMQRIDLPWIAGVFAEPDYARKPGPIRLVERFAKRVRGR
jgi:hypothetical protein